MALHFAFPVGCVVLFLRENHEVQIMHLTMQINLQRDI